MATAKKKAVQQDRRAIVGKRITLSQNDRLVLWAVHGVFVNQRKIYLGSAETDAESNESAVDAGMAKKFEIAMSILEDFSDKLPIRVIINTGGGDTYHAYAIYDRIMDSPCFVTGQGTGSIMSAGILLLQGCDKRLLTRTSSIMMHNGTPATVDNHYTNAERIVDEGRRLKTLDEDIFLAQMLKKDPTVTREKVQKLLEFDYYMDPLKAIRLGLADGLVPRTKHKKVRPKALASATPTPLDQE